MATGVNGRRKPTRGAMPLKGYAVVWYVAFGNLNNGANAGLSYVNGNNGLTNRNWNYLPRLSVNLSSKKNITTAASSLRRK